MLFWFDSSRSRSRAQTKFRRFEQIDAGDTEEFDSLAAFADQCHCPA
eukprot:SAG11_NODE_31148_length_294_cov_0.800000_1_plen_46_part_01